MKGKMGRSDCGGLWVGYFLVAFSWLLLLGLCIGQKEKEMGGSFVVSSFSFLDRKLGPFEWGYARGSSLPLPDFSLSPSPSSPLPLSLSLSLPFSHTFLSLPLLSPLSPFSLSTDIDFSVVELSSEEGLSLPLIKVCPISVLSLHNLSLSLTPPSLFLL